MVSKDKEKYNNKHGIIYLMKYHADGKAKYAHYKTYEDAVSACESHDKSHPQYKPFTALMEDSWIRSLKNMIETK